MVELLAVEEDRLNHLEYDDLSVRRSLRIGYQALASSDLLRDRDAALALRRLGQLSRTHYEAPLVARLMAVDQRRAVAALDRLHDAALIEETDLGRYELHHLVRDFARETGRRHHAEPLANF